MTVWILVITQRFNFLNECRIIFAGHFLCAFYSFCCFSKNAFKMILFWHFRNKKRKIGSDLVHHCIYWSCSLRRHLQKPIPVVGGRIEGPALETVWEIVFQQSMPDQIATLWPLLEITSNPFFDYLVGVFSFAYILSILWHMHLRQNERVGSCFFHSTAVYTLRTVSSVPA